MTMALGALDRHLGLPYCSHSVPHNTIAPRAIPTCAVEIFSDTELSSGHLGTSTNKRETSCRP